jgi:hypothetical protein
MLLNIIILSIIETLLEIFAWGTFGYLFFRFIGVNEKHWRWDYLLITTLFVIYEYSSNYFLIKLDISIGNQELLKLLDNNVNSLFETDWSSILFCAAEVFAGYTLGKIILRKLQKRNMPDN